MATIFMDNYENYATLSDGGLGYVTEILQGLYTGITNSSSESVQTAQITNTKDRYWFSSYFQSARLRKVLPAPKDTFFIGFRFFMPVMPTQDYRGPVVIFKSASNMPKYALSVSSSGQLVIYPFNSNGDILPEVSRSTSPIFSAASSYFVEVKYDSATGIRVRVNDSATDTYVYASAISGQIAQIEIGTTGNYSQNIAPLFTDLHIWDTTGSKNIDFMGDVRIYTIAPDKDILTGWSQNNRKNIDTGMGIFTQFAQPISTNNVAGIVLADQDFTIETFVRFLTMPTGTNKQTIISRYDDIDGRRIFRLYKDGATGNLIFEASYDGITTGIQVSQSFDFKTDTWYHLAVNRTSGNTAMYVDGNLLGVKKADTGIYASNASILRIGANGGDIFNPVDLNSTFNGFMDETRITVGIGRYPNSFTKPNAKFGRNISTDTNFNSVQLLIGYDSLPLYDDSGQDRALVYSDNQVFIADDGAHAFQTVNTPAIRDDTYIYAALLKAQSTLTFTTNPSAGNTVTIDGITYTFRNTLGSAYDVLIGDTAADSLLALRNAIILGSGAGTLYHNSTIIHPTVTATLAQSSLTAIAKIAGTVGNSKTVAASNGTWTTSTLSGGADIPPPSSFGFSKIPDEIVLIKSIQVVSRALKSDAGAGTLSVGFRGAGGAIANQSDINLSTTPTYYTGVFEADPDTGGSITPSGILNGKIEYNRTA